MSAAESPTRRGARNGVLFAFHVGAAPTKSLRPYLAGYRLPIDCPDPQVETADEVALAADVRQQCLKPYRLDEGEGPRP
jgi:hypothetical protein